MKKEGENSYDSGKIVRILIISILIVLILIIGSLIYVFMSGEEEGNLAPVNYAPYYLAYQNKDITLCKNDSDKKRENYCKINFAHISGNSSICSMLNENVTFPYLSKVKKLKLNLNAIDFCYITLSKSETNNYCSKISSESGKIVCMEDLE